MTSLSFQLLETLPICRDFKAGKCHRNRECRYVHLVDENVEVNQGRVVVCRDASKGRCSRIPCKYYHIPLFAISAGRSLALNSALAASLTGHASANIVSSSGNNSGNSMTAVYTGASSASVASSSSAGLVAGCGSTSASSTSPHRSI